MMYIAIAIHDRDNDLVPFLISLFTRSKAYHCELRFSDGTAISSTYPKDIHFKNITYNHWCWVCLPLPWIDAAQEIVIRKQAEEMVAAGLKYDLVGAIFGKYSKRLNKKDAYFCSELCVELLHSCTPEFDTTKWYSPEDIWKTIANKLDTEFPEYMDPGYNPLSENMFSTLIIPDA